ncbi:MAG: DUF1015 family protein [Planctomycetia bacterium]|nr:DUF1015 family protein [Planctomycetia bacterium]
MSIVKPFRGLRPKPKYAREIASPPYDVLNAQEARKIVEKNPNSFLRVNKAELEFDDKVSSYSEDVYQRGKDNLQRLIDLGLMIRDAEPCFYIYRITMDGKSQTGLVALTSVEEYDNGLIKKHEHTRPEKVNDRANHIEFLGAQAGPVFSTYRYNENIHKIFKQITAENPIIDFVANDDVRHEFWVISEDPEIRKIEEAFAVLPYLYIADGHHRSQSASEVCRRAKEKNHKHTGRENYNYFLNVMFPDQELNILPYNRVVVDLNDLTLDTILDIAADKFQISPQSSEITPTELHTFGIYCEGKWYLLKAKDGTFDPNDPTGSIDAAILGKNFIDPILDISDPKTDKRINLINFVGGIRGTQELEKLVDSGKYKIAFSLYPTSIKQLLDVADVGKVMPPKSTWFEPKLRSGMVVNLMDDV